LNTKKFIRKLLQLKDLALMFFEFQRYNQELHLFVKPYKNGCLCPECNLRGKIIRTRKEERIWRDIRVANITIFFHYNIREIDCRAHGRVQEAVPWADKYSRITYRLEYQILKLSKMIPQKDVSELLHLPKSTVSRLLHDAITRIRAGHRIRGLKSIGVDEIAYKKNKKYATIVYDLDKSRVIWVGDGKKKETLNTFFNDKLSIYQKKQIKWASCDMSEGYINAIIENCPNVKLVLDKFHIVKALGTAMDEVRKQQWRELSKSERKAIKGLRWLLFKHSSNRSKSDTRIINRLKTGNRRIYRAWVLKDEFEHFWNYKYFGAAYRFLKKWITRVLKSRLDPLRKVALTIRKYINHIITYVQRSLTNAVGEGINRVIKIIKNRASGFKTLDAFSDLIYLTVGDLDILAQIPRKYCTI